MRWLRVLRSRGADPGVVVAGLVTATACGGRATSDPIDGQAATGGVAPGAGGVESGGQSAAGTGGTAGATPLAGTGGGVIDVPPNGGAAATVPPGCYEYSVVDTFEVPLPEEGISPKDLCPIDVVGAELACGDAARLSFRTDPDDVTLLHARILITPDLAPLLAGLPEVEVVPKSATTVTEVRLEEAEYRFEVLLPESFRYGREVIWSQPRYTEYQIKLPLRCTPWAETTMVVTVVSMSACWDEAAEAWTWRGPGEPCTMCYLVGEGAAPPLPTVVPDERLALGEALEVGVRCVARVGAALVLLATGGAGAAAPASFAWSVSRGRLLFAERDVAVWEPPPATALGDVAQVVVQGRHGVGVATFPAPS